MHGLWELAHTRLAAHLDKPHVDKPHGVDLAEMDREVAGELLGDQGTVDELIDEARRTYDAYLGAVRNELAGGA
jgi:hypothetical protein